MAPTILVRKLTGDEQQALWRGLMSADGFTVRRSQVLLASAGGAGPEAIGRVVGLSAQAVRNAIRTSRPHGLGCPALKTPAAKAPAAVWDRTHDGGRGLGHRRPREFGRPTSLWALALAAEVCHAKGWTSRRLTAEGMRGVLAHLGAKWRRAKHWITIPDPEYAKKKSGGTG